ncbi:MAG TPA: lasso peptide biosynthesis B2 protein [Thermoanaerobaculia bacterium]|jgi:hypothetical protein
MTKASSASSDALRTALRLSWSDRSLFLEAALRLFVARIFVVALPFRILSRRLGAHMSESPREVAHDALARRVRWAIAAVSRRAPWRCKCLEQAIAAKMMLRARGAANTLYMGVARAGGGHVDAHAWLRCGDFFVTGGDGSVQYSVVATFADEGRAR